MPTDEERVASPAAGASPAVPAAPAASAPTAALSEAPEAPVAAAAASPAASSGQNAAPSEEKPAGERAEAAPGVGSPQQAPQPPPGSALQPPASFSSSPVAPVVASNHQRRWRRELGWVKPDGDARRREGDALATTAANAAAASPSESAHAKPTMGRAAREASEASSSSETSEEDIRAPKPKTPENADPRQDQQASPPRPAVDDKQEESNQEDHQRLLRLRAQEEMRRPDYESVKGSAYAEDRRTPSPVDRDFRIMFKGRQIFADDLIGLRVAKTFAGHGRFLGQVVKFDGPTGLYTVVYADGDAEDLSVDSTIEILIQDEIERVDPTLPPPATSLFFKREVASSVSGDEPMEAATSAQYASPREYARPDLQRSLSSASSQGYRSTMRITDREAQFVVGLFESHALPILLQQGWRVQTNPAGGESRYVAPGVSDGFSGSGTVFRSALDVVEYIASDDELLAACFPSNVHAAILSLLPDSRRRQGNEAASSMMGGNIRKRGVSEVPGDEAFGTKRHRQPREDMYRGGPPDMRRMQPAGVSPRVEQGMGGRGYRPADIGYRPRERDVPIRQGAPSDQYATEGGRRAAPLVGSRQAYYASMEYTARHSRHLSDSSSSSRWSSEHVPRVSDKPVYQRRYEESPRWDGREAREQYPPGYAAAEAGRAYPRAERYYPGERGMERPRSSRAAIPADYRYPDRQEELGDSQPPVAGGVYAHRYGDRVDSRQMSSGVESITARLPRDAAIYNAGDGRVRMENPGISMMDVERLAGPRSGGRTEQSTGRSSHEPVGGTAYASFRRHYASQRGGEPRYASDAEANKPVATPDTPSDTPYAQNEQRVT